MAWQENNDALSNRAPRLLRFAAWLFDLLLAFVVVLFVRLLVRVGVLGALGSWSPGVDGAWIDKQLVILSLVLAAFRDVLGSASPVKWLLCLRVVSVDGKSLGFFQRLLRAPSSLLPITWLFRGVEEHMPWRVVTYTPGPFGLATRAVVTALAAVVSIGWTIESLRPSIGRHDATRLAQTLVDDPMLRRQLGEPLDYQIHRVQPRSRQTGSGRASFRLQVRGPELLQDMVVHARKVDGAWTVEELLDIDIRRLHSDENDPVASR